MGFKLNHSLETKLFKYMETLTKLQLASLNKRVNIEEFGIVTKREFIERAKMEGWTVEAKETTPAQHGEFNRRHYNRLSSGQDQYEAKMNQKKTVYSIHPPEGRGFYDITKTEFEYFNSI